MSDPRGAAAGSGVGLEQPAATSTATPPTEPTPAKPVRAAASNSPRLGPGDRGLDASAHAHVLDDPLPPELPDDTPLFRQLREHSDEAPPADAAPLPRQGTAADLRDTEVLDRIAPGPPAVTADGAAASEAPVEAPSGGIVGTGTGRPGRGLRVTAAVASIALVATGVLAAYLYQSARDWRDHAAGYLAQAQDLGEELAQSRSDLAGAQAELEAVRAQLTTAHQRITELADEKAQIGDEREVTQQLVAYQERISVAAGQVALKLDQCVQGQQELIGYLQRIADDPTTALPPDQLAQFEGNVEAFCQAASEANIALQRELSR